MTNLPLFPEFKTPDDDTPLPLLVAKKWGFPLAFHIVEGKYMYAIQDWLRGLTGSKDIRQVWDHFKKQKAWAEMSTSSVYRMAYTACDGKTYKRDFTTGENLTVITQHLRELESRPILRDTKVFLNHQLTLQDEKRFSYALVPQIAECEG